MTAPSVHTLNSGNGETDLLSPEVIFCGFSRISSVSRDQSLQSQNQIALAQEIVVTVTLLGADRYTFTTAIHKQADIQTLARTVEALLTERRTIVACLIDLGSDNVLRWSDIVDDVLDGDSVIGIVPLSEATLIRTVQLAQIPSQATTLPDGEYQSQSAPLPQLEFIQVAPARSRANSLQGSVASTTDTYYIDTALVRKRSEMLLHKPSVRALRRGRQNGASAPTVTRNQDIPEVDRLASHLPLPQSPTTQPVPSPLEQICTNSILLLAFCRYCVRKKTLCELLYWLDTTAIASSSDFLHRIYLDTNAPLKLNLPREVSTVLEARELLRDGLLTWSEQGFERSGEGMRARAIQSKQPLLFKSAAITLLRPIHPDRQSFISLLSKAFDPEDTSILSLRERGAIDTRQAILDQICAQYFPGGQVDTRSYFKYNEEQLTKPEKARLTNRRMVYGGMFDKNDVLSKLAERRVSETRTTPSRPTIPYIKTAEKANQDHSRSGIVELMPMEDADVSGWTDIAGPKSPVRDTATTGKDYIVNKADAQSQASVYSLGRNGSAISISHVPRKHASQRGRSGSSTSSIVSDESRATTANLTLTEAQRADLVKRQMKLRTLLGVSPREVLDRQGSHHMASGHRVRVRAHSPSPSVASRYTTASTNSRMSLSRAEKDEELERRSQVRRAAKLYAMFGEHADSAGSIPSYRQSPRDRRTLARETSRPASQASQYSPSLARSPSRQSMSAQSINDPLTKSRQAAQMSTPNSRYQPNRDSGRRSFKSLMFKTPRGTSLPSEVLSGFPEPPSMANPTSPSFRRHLAQQNKFGSSLHDADSILEESGSEDEYDAEGEAIVQDVRTNMKLRQLLGNDAPTTTLIT